MNKTDTEPKTNWNQMQTVGGDQIRLTFMGCCRRRQCKVLEVGQAKAGGENEDEVTSGENEDEATCGENEDEATGREN
jgi:hypothetical protein